MIPTWVWCVATAVYTIGVFACLYAGFFLTAFEYMERSVPASTWAWLGFLSLLIPAIPVGAVLSVIHLFLK